MHWVLILAVLLATTLAEKAPSEAVDHAGMRMLLALAAMLVSPALAATMTAVVIRGIRRDIHSWAMWVARFGLGQQLHAALLVALVGAISYGLAWPQVVRVNLGLGNWVLVDDLLILAPIYVPLLLSWAVFYDVDRTVYELTAEEDEPVDSPARWKYVLLHARHYLGLVLVPLLLVLTLYDSARILAPGFIEGPHGWMLVLPLVVLSVIALPQLLSLLWKTESLPTGELRERLTAVLRDCRLRVRDILVWRTEGRMTNAAVSGLLARVRYVFLTDRLLESLDDEEIAAVVRHEAGHVVHHHLLLRMLLLGLPVAVWMAVIAVAPQAPEQASAALSSLGISRVVQECLLVPGLVAMYGLLALGGYCKQLEFEADLFACAGEGALDEVRAAAFVAALYKITAQGGGDGRRDGWLHPSILRRVRFVRSALSDPLLATRFRRRLVLVAWMIAGVYGVSLFAIALSV